MKLYYSSGACSLATHIVLNQLAIPYEAISVNLQNKTTETGEDFTKMSRFGAVPLLTLDDGESISEGQVILGYLANRYPEKNLAPVAGTMERVRHDEWLNFVATEMHKSFYVFFRGGDDNAKALYQNKLEKHFALLEGQFETNDYLTGASFTIADAYLYTVLRWADALQMDLHRFPSLCRFMERMEKREAVRQTLSQEGLVPKDKAA